MIEIIKITISNQSSKVELLDTIYTNNKEQYRVHFIFDTDDWNNYNKMVVFDRVKNYDTPIGINITKGNSELVEIINEKEFYCVLPWEVITQPGYFNISIYGTYTNENGELLTKNYILPDKFTIQNGGDKTVYPRVPTPNMYEQLAAAYLATKDIADEAMDIASAAEETVSGFSDRIAEVEEKVKEGTGVGKTTEQGGEIFNDYTNNKATGLWSHAEGSFVDVNGVRHPNQASGVRSHVEGSGNKATTYDTHAEGSLNEASGNQAHAEGYQTKATNFQAHAEGSGTTASGVRSHAEGLNTKAQGSESHSEGNNTTASGPQSHAEGSGTTGSGDQAHGEGYQTTASGAQSHSEGHSSKAIGARSHAGGLHSEAQGSQSFVHGTRLVANETNQFVVGKFNDETEKGLFVVGNGSGDTWNGTTRNGKNAFVVKEDGSVIIGKSNIDNDNAVVNSKLLKDYVKNNSSDGVGETTEANGEIFNLYEDTKVNVGTIDGIDLGEQNLPKNIASNYSHAEGAGTEATGKVSHAEGILTKVTGDAAHTEGVGTLVTGSAAHGEGLGYNCNLTVTAVSENTITVTSSKSLELTLIDDNSVIWCDEIAYNDKGKLIGGFRYVTNVNGNVLTLDKEHKIKVGKTVTLIMGGALTTSSHKEGEFSTTVDLSATTFDGSDVNNKNQHAEGSNTLASGKAAHSEGSYTRALGDYSHSEGKKTLGSGDYSHAEGLLTEATESSAHAEGYQTHANGKQTHAEGYNTVASGENAHAEGHTTQANKDNSHAEGTETIANGHSSHTEGYKTQAIGFAAHAEGQETIAQGAYSHASGIGTIANTTAQTVVGKYNEEAEGAIFVVGDGTDNDHRSTAFSVYSSGAIGGKAVDYIKNMTIGRKTNEGGEIFNFYDTAVVEGNTFVNEASQYSHAEGFNTKAIGGKAHAEGQDTIASGIVSHTEGFGTNAKGFGAHAEGGLTQSNSDYSHSEGSNTVADKQYSHAEGLMTKALGISSHSEGSYTEASNENTHAEGQSTKAIGMDSHAEGISTTAEGFASHAEGGFTYAKNNYSHTEGYNTIAEGVHSHAEGLSTQAIGENSHAEGSTTKASGHSSHAGGWETQATAFAQTAIGAANATDANALFIVGNGTGNKDGSLNRSNAFVVKVDGTATIQTAGINDNNVVNYGQLKPIKTAVELLGLNEKGGRNSQVTITNNSLDSNNLSGITIGPAKDKNEYIELVNNKIRIGGYGEHAQLTQNSLTIHDYDTQNPNWYASEGNITISPDKIELSSNGNNTDGSKIRKGIKISSEGITYNQSGTNITTINKTITWDKLFEAIEKIENIIDVSEVGQ